MTDPEPLQLHTARVRTGEELQGRLVLREVSSGPGRARRLRIRAQGELVDKTGKATYRQVLTGGPSAVQDKRLRGKLPVAFTLVLTGDLPPSYQGKRVQVSWQVVASLHANDGTEVMRWSQPFQLEPGRTVHPPKWRELPAPRASSLPAWFNWVALIFPGLLCFFPGMSVLINGLFDSRERPSVGEQIIISIFSLALIAGGVLVTRWLIGRLRTVSKFKEAMLKPLAERIPLGSTARLRAFLSLTQALSVRGAWLELTAYEGIDKIRSADSVTVSLPEHLAQGPHQFDLELPIPRDFPPTITTRLSARCTLTLQLEGLEDMVLHGSLELAPEVLEIEE